MLIKNKKNSKPCNIKSFSLIILFLSNYKCRKPFLENIYRPLISYLFKNKNTVSKIESFYCQ